MKYCQICGILYQSTDSICRECKENLSELKTGWLIELSPGNVLVLTTEEVQARIKKNEFCAYHKIIGPGDKDWNRLFEVSFFHKLFSREDNWTLQLPEGFQYPISKDKIVKLIKEKSLTGDERCFHPSENKWYLVKECLEFIYLFETGLKTCSYCGAKNAKTSVLCWKCFKAFINPDNKGFEIDRSRITLEEPEEVTLERKKFKARKLARQRLTLQLIIIILVVVSLGFVIRFYQMSQVVDIEIAQGVELFNTTSHWEEREYGGYKVKNFVISGKLRNSSNTSKKIIILTGYVFTRNSELISKKSVNVFKEMNLNKPTISKGELINPGEEFDFEIRFYRTDIFGKDISSWDVRITKVIE